MPTCPMCGGSPRESTIFLDSAARKLEECENTIIRLENQGVIKFSMGIAMGVILGAVVVIVSLPQKGLTNDAKDGIRQISQSRAN